jgi:hypothetical protein
MHVGRLKIILIDSSTCFQHGHLLLVYGHVKMGKVPLYSMHREVFVQCMVVGTRYLAFAHPSPHVQEHKTNNYAIIVK